jgi:hypothetical protein
MKRLLILPCLALGLCLAACGHHLENVPNATSRIFISADGNPVSEPGDTAAITMNIGEHRTYQIMRSVTKAGDTTTTDVTAQCDYNFTDPDVAAMDVSGQLTALASGFTTLTVKYRPNNTDPTETDDVSMDITVNPNP